MCYERSSGRLFGGKITQFAVCARLSKREDQYLQFKVSAGDNGLLIVFLDCLLIVKVSITTIINVYIPVLMMNQVIAVQGRRPALWL